MKSMAPTGMGQTNWDPTHLGQVNRAQANLASPADQGTCLPSWQQLEGAHPIGADAYLHGGLVGVLQHHGL